MSRTTKQGGSVLEHLKAVEKIKGSAPPELKKFYSTKCPPEMEGFYFWWLDLHERRTYQEGIPCPLTYPEIAAWKELTQEDITPYGVSVLCSIDRLYLKHQLKKV